MLTTIPWAFIGQNLNFAVNLFVALACFTAGWLYLDAPSNHHPVSKVAKYTGFFLLAAGFLVNGTIWPGSAQLAWLADTLRLLGYSGIIIGNLLEPLQPQPKNTGLTFDTWPAMPSSRPAGFSFGLPGGLLSPVLLPPLGAIIASLLYWRRGIWGLERHLIRLALTFSIFALAELLSLTRLWDHSDNPLLQALVQPLSPLWLLDRAMLVLAGFLLIRWVWRYLTKRPTTQFFLTAVNATFAIVLVTSLSLTSALLSSLQKESLANLETATKVLDYAIKSQTAETRAEAAILAQNAAVAQAVSRQDHAALITATNDNPTHKQFTETILTNATGQVLYRASDPERYNDSLSDDPLVIRALAGSTYSSIVSLPGVLAPNLVMTTASPIRADGRIIGTALSSQALDNSFVDGLKQSTGLDSTVYSGATRTATTLVATDGTSRSIGLKETTPSILTTTLRHGQIWSGPTTIANQAFLAIYLPLKNANNEVVGMLSVAQRQTASLQTARQALQLTFLASVICLICLIVPIYWVARQITRQL